MNTNAQILAAILNRVGQPVIQHFMGLKMQNSPVVNGIENWVRNLGIAGPNWNLTGELMPFIQPLSGRMVEPILAQYLANVPDAMIPGMAHSLVDEALKQGQISLLGGMITLDSNDLAEIKKLLNANMPYIPMQPVALKEGTEAPEKTQETEVKNDGSNDTGADSKQGKHS
jgi:hypothetical protein